MTNHSPLPTPHTARLRRGRLRGNPGRLLVAGTESDHCALASCGDDQCVTGADRMACLRMVETVAEVAIVVYVGVFVMTVLVQAGVR